MKSRFHDPKFVRPFNGRPMIREPFPDDNILKPAAFNPKLGGDFERPGQPLIPSRVIYRVEYDDCDDKCLFKVRGECLGNNTFADRYIASENNRFWPIVEREVRHLNRRHWRFFVRLHGLGDFKTLAYLLRWLDLLRRYSALHIWGTTGHPVESEIGQAIIAALEEFGPRFRMLFSNQVAERGTTHVFKPDEITWTNDKPDPWQTLVRSGKTYRYFLCPENIDTYLPGIPPENPHKCSTCGFCPFVEPDLTPPPNIGWVER